MAMEDGNTAVVMVMMVDEGAASRDAAGGKVVQ
jgi:hypothetical protein